MSNLFSPDSWVMRILSRIADLVILNILFLLTCTPIITIGASLAALYAVVFPMGTVNDKGVVRAYFKAFGQNFKNATLMWLGFAVVTVLLVLDYRLFISMAGSPLALCFIIAVILLLIEGMAFGYVFPLMSLFDNTLKGTLKNALALSLASPLRSLAVLALNMFPFFLLMRYPYLFFSAAFILWMIIWFSGSAYLIGRILRKVVAPYLPDDAFLPAEVQDHE